ncbi:protein translocase subunit SecF [Leifsonia sp. Root112D2]|jgi:preprotein translocase subunit SecF|uniref:protein translocase subunit SecF n=1 Tax=Leifsonia sp. Root112D2 TaxID=1736426 RepID=UPI000700218B|nr:protein translocase subunit SecF [Leifsonia sp. Root112D2]KQV08028.1 preprotein translocase subunit SecF [Leifsonia sp. Root112D2]
MATRFQRFGNDLYTGARSIDFVGKRKIWYAIAVLVLIASIVIPIAKGGFNFGIDFRGGSQFQITNVKTTDQSLAERAVASVAPNSVAQVSSVNDNGVRVQTDQLTAEQTKAMADALAKAYDVPVKDVASSFIGPSWGADVSRQAIQGLVVFLLLAFIAMALYFRTWKMSAAAIISLLHDLVLTAGIYALVGFEVTPATMIGFLTILGYSLYDTVVVFDKIRENTSEEADRTRHTYAESVNLAVNQTLVRSINTAVVAALPVGAILFIGAFIFGADTLRDISLALFIGILVGTYSTIYIAAPLYSEFREPEAAIRKHDRKVLAARAKVDAASAVPAE